MGKMKKAAEKPWTTRETIEKMEERRMFAMMWKKRRTEDRERSTDNAKKE